MVMTNNKWFNEKDGEQAFPSELSLDLDRDRRAVPLNGWNNDVRPKGRRSTPSVIDVDRSQSGGGRGTSEGLADSASDVRTA
jgi:hypothetical protein